MSGYDDNRTGDRNRVMAGGLSNSRDGRGSYSDSYNRDDRRNRDYYSNRGGGRYHNNRDGGYNGGRHGRGRFDNRHDQRPPPPSRGYDKPLDAARPRYGATLGGRGRGRGPRLPGNVKERANQVFASEQVMLSKEIITRLGDFRSEPNNIDQLIGDMRDMAEVLVSTNDLQLFKDDMSELFNKSFSQLTVQGPLIATLLSLMSKFNNEFPMYLVGKVLSSMKDAISKCDLLPVKLSMRCFAVLASCGALALKGPGGFEELITVLVNAGGPALGDDGDDAFSFSQVAAIYLLASTAPYMATVLVHSSPKSLSTSCLSLFQRVLKKYKSPYDTMGKNAVFNVNTTMIEDPSQGPEDMACWDTLWESCSVAASIFAGESDATPGDQVITAADGAHVPSSSFTYPVCFLRPWTLIAEDMNKPFALAVIEESAPEAGGDESVPASEPVKAEAPEPVPVLEGGLLRFPVEDLDSLSDLLRSPAFEESLRVSTNPSYATLGKGVHSWLSLRFPIFDEQAGPAAASCVALSQFERYYMSDTFRDIFFFFQPYIRDDGTRIGSMELVAVNLLAAFKLFPEDTNVHLEYVLVETLLLLLVQVPPAVSAGMCRTLLELCKKSSLIPPVIASITAILVQLFPAMDTLAWRNVTGWLASHLTNSKLAWPFWEHWCEEYTQSPPDSVNRSFMNLLLEKCSRSVPAQTLRKALPEAVHGAIIDDFVPAAEPLFSGIGEDSMSRVARAVFQRIEQREDADELQEWLEDEHEGLDDSLQAEHWRVGLLMKAILVSGGQKTLSQLINLFEKYRESLRDLGESDGAQMVIIDACFAIMGHDLGYTCIIMDVIIRRGLLKSISLTNYVCSNTVLSQLAAKVHFFVLFEISVERSVDVAMALVSKRKNLVGKGLEMESDATAVVKDYSGAVTHVMSMGGGGGNNKSEATGNDKSSEENITGTKRDRDDETEERDEEDAEDLDDDTGRSWRRRKLDGDDSKTPATTPLKETDLTIGDINTPSSELLIVDAALVTALQDCRTIYSKVVTSLILGIVQRQKELNVAAASNADENDEVSAMLDPWNMNAYSLLRFTLRSFHGAQSILDRNGDSEYKLIDVDSVIFEISDATLPEQLSVVWKAFTKNLAI